MCTSILLTCRYVPGDHGCQRKECIGSQGTGVKDGCRHHRGAGKQTQVLRKTASALNL